MKETKVAMNRSLNGLMNPGNKNSQLILFSLTIPTPFRHFSVPEQERQEDQFLRITFLQYCSL